MRGEQEIDGVKYKEAPPSTEGICTGCSFHSVDVGCLHPWDSPSCGDGILIDVE